MRRFDQSIFFFVVAFFLAGTCIHARQEIQYDRFPDDSLFIRALNSAHDGDHKEALKISLFLLQRNEFYYDASVLAGRIYAWEKQYDSARIYLINVTDALPDYHDALSALIDIELWAGNYLQAAGNAANALNYHPGDEVFMLKKAEAYLLHGSREEAVEILEYLLEINPDNQEAPELMDNLNEPELYYYRDNNYLLAGYYGDFFQDPYSRHFHMGTAGYSHHNPWGSLTGKVNFANVYFDGTGLTKYPSLQYEVESYPIISSDSYSLLNYAYSQSMVFPEHRAAFEYFRALPLGYEASLGLRFLYWDDSYLFYTGSAGKYYENMWFSLRTYILPNDDQVSSSWYFNARKYFNSADEYAGIIFGYGFLPDETFLDPDERIFLNTASIGAELSKGFSLNYLMRGSLRYEYEEFIEGSYRNRWRINLGLRYFF